MKSMLCKYQDTLFDTSTQMRVSRCICAHCKYFISQFLSPDICFACPQREIPDAAEIKLWESRFLQAGDEGIQRPEAAIEFIFSTFCHKCSKYNSLTTCCETCNCPSGQVPVKERIRLEQFNCPLNLW